MSRISSILMFGHDVSLLQTRCLILERSGFPVHVASDLTTVEEIASVETIDLFILCYTLTEKEKKKAISISLTHNPVVLNFVLAEILPAHGGHIDGRDYGDFVFTKTFLSAVKSVIQQNQIDPLAIE